jgi:hypothetical protein
MVVVCGLCLAAGACRQAAENDSQPAVESSRDLASAAAGAVELDGLMIGAPVRHKNLTVFPVLAKGPKNEDKYLTLDEGLKAGTIEVREVGAGAQRELLPGLPGDDPFSDPPVQRETPAAGAADEDPFAAPTQVPALPGIEADTALQVEAQATPPLGRRRIEEALASETKLEFVETPLSDVVDYLTELSQIF